MVGEEPCSLHHVTILHLYVKVDIHLLKKDRQDLHIISPHGLNRYFYHSLRNVKSGAGGEWA